MDEHVPSAVTAGLRARGVDVLTAQEAGRVSVEDEVHLALATSLGRALVSRDADFARLHACGISHTGIVYMPYPMSVGESIRRLLLVYEVLDAEEMVNHLEYL